jgi:uncharacterized protein
LRSLYDVNSLIALFDPQHTQHLKIRARHEAQAALGWATCPITQNGLLRIVSQPKYTNPSTVSELRALLASATNDQSNELWADDISLADSQVIDAQIALTSGMLTSVYLLALAVKNNGRLITFDSRISHRAVVGATPVARNRRLSAKLAREQKRDRSELVRENCCAS